MKVEPIGKVIMKTFLREILITIGLAFIIFLVARETVQTYEVFMSSMEPSFYEGDRVVVNKVVYWFNEPERGDVIIFREPNGSQDDFIKRVIAIPGDKVRVADRTVYVNDTKLEEPYIKDAPRYSVSETVVPDGCYFVLGDNRNHSNDSHNNWFVSDEDVHGKAWITTWPPVSWGVVPEYDLALQLAETATGPETAETEI